MNLRSRSLSEYRKKYQPQFAVKLSMRQNVEYEEVINAPLFAVSLLNKFI